MTVIWTWQNSTGTGVVKNGGAVKLFAATGVAAIEITSGKWRLESLVQLSAAAGAAKTAIDAASAAVKPQSFVKLALSVMFFPPMRCGVYRTHRAVFLVYAAPLSVSQGPTG